jgi:multidrug resistance protein, MATE family
MTETSLPLADYRRVLRLAIPIVLANLTQPVLGMVDTAIAGHFPDVLMLGGVAVGALMFAFLFWTFGFLRMSTTGLIAQAFGANDKASLRLTLWRAMTLAMLIGSLVVAFQDPLIRIGARLISEDTGLLRQVGVYCAARIWSAPFALANYVVLGYLLGVQQVRTALVVQILVNLVNGLAAVVLVYGLHFGIGGIGAATAIADLTGFLLGVAVLTRQRAYAGLPAMAELFHVPALMKLIALNVNLLGRTLCLLAVFGWFTRASATISLATLAGNTVLLNFQTFMAFGLDGFAQACEALVGAAIGAKDRGALKRWIRASTALATLVAALFTLVYGLFGALIIGLLTNLESVRAEALAYLPFAALSPLVSIWGFQLDGVFIGATRTRDLFLAMIVASASFALALALLSRFGNVGLWLSFLVFMAMRGLTLAGFLPFLVRSVPAPEGFPHVNAQ